jgi:hypothetical protein
MAAPPRNLAIECKKLMPNNAINSDVSKRRFALLWHAGYGERYADLLITAISQRFFGSSKMLDTSNVQQVFEA